MHDIVLLPKYNVPFLRLRYYSKITALINQKNMPYKKIFSLPIIEIVSIALMMASLVMFGVTPKGISFCVFFSLLSTLGIIDAISYYLPNNLNYSLLLSGIVVNAFSVVIDAKSAVVSGISIFLILWLIREIFYLLTKKDQLGMGDLKLCSGLGVWFGLEGASMMIIMSSFLMLIRYLMFKLSNKKNDMIVDLGLPFAPYLAVSSILYLFFQVQLTHLFQ